MTMLCALTCASLFSPPCIAKAQTAAPPARVETQQPALPSAIVKGFLPDGSYLVTIGGVNYKAITGEYAKTLLQNQHAADEQLDRCQRARVNLDEQMKVYDHDLAVTRRELAVADRESKGNALQASRFETLYLGEKDLRRAAENLYAPPGSVDRFFNNPIVKLANEFGKPLLQGWLASRNKTTVVMPDGTPLSVYQKR
jgi:hypothetical protein